MFFEVKMQEDGCRWCIYKFNLKKTAQITHLQENKLQTRYRPAYLEVSK